MGAGRAAGQHSGPGLSRRQWGNVGLVALFSQGVQLAFVSLVIAAFFVGSGLLTVRPATGAASAARGG